MTVPIPKGYHEQLDALQALFGGEVVKGKNAPYWWDGIFDVENNKRDKRTTKHQTNGQVAGADADPNARAARSLWEGWRDIEGYARDIFPVEERLNGKDWMDSQE